MNYFLFFLIAAIIGAGVFPASAYSQNSCMSTRDSGFSSPVTVAVSDNCSRIIAGSASSGIVSLFDEKQNLLWAYHTNSTIHDVAISPDGQILYAATVDGNVHCLNSEGTRLWTFRNAGCSPRVFPSPSGSTGLIINTNDPKNLHYSNFHLFAANGTVTDERNDPSILDAIMTDDYDYVVLSLGQKAQTLLLYSDSGNCDLASPVAGYNIHTAISADARIIAVANPGDFTMYNRFGDRISAIHSDYYINTVATSPEGDMAFLGTQYDISAYAGNGTRLWNFFANEDVTQIASSFQGNTTIAVTSRQRLPDAPTSTVYRFSASGDPVWKIPIRDSLGSLAVSKDAECIVAGSFNDTVYFVSAEGNITAEQLHSLPFQPLPTTPVPTLVYHTTGTPQPSPGPDFLLIIAIGISGTAGCCYYRRRSGRQIQR